MPDLDWARLTKLLAEPCLRELADIAAAGHDLAIVGGALRDSLLGREPQDIDVVVTSDFDAALTAVAAHRGRAPVDIGDRFQRTRRCHWHGRRVDLSASAGGLREDLARRDLTVNALAVPLPVAGVSAADVIDPVGGLDDLRRGVLRQVAADNFAADPLRVLRVARYRAELPSFVLDSETRTNCVAVAPALAGVAGERIATEWQALLAAPAWEVGVSLAWEIGAGEATLGARRSAAGARAWALAELEDEDDDAGAPENPETHVLDGRLAAVLFDLVPGADAEALAAHLRERRWPARLARRAARAARWAGARGVGVDDLADWALADAAAASLAGRLARRVGAGGTARLLQLAERAREPRWIDGAEAKAAGIAEGPELGRLLSEAARGQILRRWPSATEARRWLHEVVS